MREGWEYKKLGDIVSFCSGSRPQGGVGTISEGALSLGGEHIGKDGHISLSTPKYVSLEYYTNNSKGHIEDNDILLCKDGALTGKVAILRDELKEQKAMVNEHVFILRSVKTTQPFLFYYLYSPSGQIHLKQRISGAAQGGLNGANLKTIPIPIPPLSEQQQIVSELDLLSSVIEKQKAQIEELDKLAQSIFYDMFGDPVENEKGWEVKKLGVLCEIGTGATPSRTKENLYYGGNIPWVKTTEVCYQDIYDTEEKITPLAIKETNCKVYPVGTLLMAMYGQGKTRGQVAKLMVEAATNQACAAIQVDNMNIHIDYLYALMLIEYDSIRAMAQGGNQANLNMKLVGSIPVPLPPLSLQQEFADKIQAIESMKVKVRQSLKESETLFNSRMDFYFS